MNLDDYIEEGHFLLSSGKHSNKYFEKRKLFCYPNLVTKEAEILLWFMKEFKDQSLKYIHTTIGPTTTGILLAHEVARLSGSKLVLAERDSNGNRFLSSEILGENVLIVDDVLTTGKSIEEILEIIPEGNNINISVIVDRSENKLDFEYRSNYRLDLETYDEESCPLCKNNIPIRRLGHSR
jgi:orotate phosphoribosyltransferase